MNVKKGNLMRVCIIFISLLAALHCAGLCGDEGNDNLSLYHSIQKDCPTIRKALTGKEQQYIYDLVASGHVTSIGALSKYDPDHQTGFCFGRAMAVHLLSHRIGLAEESIKKLFIVGCLGSGGKTEWRFHVATMVKGDDGGWHALEMNVAKGPLTVQEWVAEMHRVWDPEKKARIYAASPSWVMPDVSTFREINEEKGTDLIELSFDPSHRTGFRSCTTYGAGLYEVDNRTAGKYFIGTDEEELNRFDFGQIVINGETYGYRGYFDDMLRWLKDVKMQGQTSVPAVMPQGKLFYCLETEKPSQL